MIFNDARPVRSFFALLRSGLYGTPIPEPDLPESIDWRPVIGLAKKHGVLGIIISAVQYLPENLRPAAPLLARLNKFAIGLIQTNVILDNTVARLVTFLGSHGISGVLLKGQGTARYYREPQMRQSGDIDFYLGKSQFRKAVSLCKAELSEPGTSSHSTAQHFDFYMSGVLIELHRLASRTYSPLRNRAFQKWIVDQLRHSPDRRTLHLANASVVIPSYDFDAIYIFYHAWRHFIMGGIGLRQLCDWALIFRNCSDRIDHDALKANLRRFGMTEGWKLFACIAVGYLGVPPDRMPLFDPSYFGKSEKILEEIVDGGNFGYFSNDYIKSVRHRGSLRYGLDKIRFITRCYFSLFPLMPVEATFLYFNRLFTGTLYNIIKSPFKH